MYPSHISTHGTALEEKFACIPATSWRVLKDDMNKISDDHNGGCMRIYRVFWPNP